MSCESHQPPTAESGFDTPMNVQVSRGVNYCAGFSDDQVGFTDVLRGADRLLADGRQPVVVPPLRLGAVGSPMEEDIEPPVAKSPPQKARAGDSDSTFYASSGTNRSRSSGALRRGRVRRRLRADKSDDRLGEILTVVQGNGVDCRQLGERVPHGS